MCSQNSDYNYITLVHLYRVEMVRKTSHVLRQMCDGYHNLYSRQIIKKSVRLLSQLMPGFRQTSDHRDTLYEVKFTVKQFLVYRLLTNPFKLFSSLFATIK